MPGYWLARLEGKQVTLSTAGRHFSLTPTGEWRLGRHRPTEPRFACPIDALGAAAGACRRYRAEMGQLLPDDRYTVVALFAGARDTYVFAHEKYSGTPLYHARAYRVSAEELVS